MSWVNAPSVTNQCRFCVLGLSEGRLADLQRTTRPVWVEEIVSNFHPLLVHTFDGAHSQAKNYLKQISSSDRVLVVVNVRS